MYNNFIKRALHVLLLTISFVFYNHVDATNYVAPQTKNQEPEQNTEINTIKNNIRRAFNNSYPKEVIAIAYANKSISNLNINSNTKKEDIINRMLEKNLSTEQAVSLIEYGENVDNAIGVLQYFSYTLPSSQNSASQ